MDASENRSRATAHERVRESDPHLVKEYERLQTLLSEQDYTIEELITGGRDPSLALKQRDQYVAEFEEVEKRYHGAASALGFSDRPQDDPAGWAPVVTDHRMAAALADVEQLDYNDAVERGMVVNATLHRSSDGGGVITVLLTTGYLTPEALRAVQRAVRDQRDS